MSLDSLIANLEKRNVTPVTLANIAPVTLNIKQTADCTLVTPVTSQFTKDEIEEWIYNNPPAGYEITHCAFCGDVIDFTGGYQAWGKVYLCHHSPDNEHLKPYLKLRIKEAENNL